MADFIPSKKTASDFNNGVQYVNRDLSQGIQGDVVQAETINNLVESALYSQEQADSAKGLVDSVVTSAYVPPLVGMHHIQFAGEPTPAEIWAGTTWEIDTDYQGRTIIGSGDGYMFGANGGETSHTLTVAEMPNHTHNLPTGSAGYFGTTRFCGSDGAGENLELATLSAGGSQPHNNMPPYTVVNYWKRTA